MIITEIIIFIWIKINFQIQIYILTIHFINLFDKPDLEINKEIDKFLRYLFQINSKIHINHLFANTNLKIK